MSESKLISPLLDGFAMGNPISEHSGIRCCPAIKENTDKKYIVKVIAIPASQVQMDALLLAGAFKDPSGAMDYFREKGEEILQEAELLKKLSKLEGFLSYEGWQMEPITRNRLGYEVYLVGSYKRSLDRYIRHHAVTHLEAVNLGLDMCNALSVCRQAGALYVDLKPSNIFMSDKKEYRIGDLGFLSMDSLRYAALPEKYQSSYTPPELYDPMASVNLTADTYALGMILYQLYNDGTLPFRGKAPEEALPSPVHADYELAEIIMKAIHPDPEQRWSDPAQMGKALASYMQRNSINDVAITPLRTKKPKTKKPSQDTEPAEASAAPEQPAESVASEAVAEPEASIPVQKSSEESAQMPQADPVVPTISSEEIHTDEELYPEEEAVPEEEPVSEQETPEEFTEESEDSPSPLSVESVIEESVIEEFSEEPVPQDDVSEDDNIVTEEVSDEEPLVLSDELSRFFAKADDLIAHETPEGVQIPEVSEEPDPFAFVLDEEEIDDSDVPYDPLMEDEEAEKPEKKKKHQKKYADPKYKQRRKRFTSALIAIIVFVLVGLAGFWYYQNQYLQIIDGITITGDRNQITVQVDTKVDESLLRVTCLDNYGKSETVPVYDGQAVFTGLQPKTMYTIRLDIDGFHQLVGKTSDIFTTDATTNIVSFTSVAGSEDGSVVLSFTVDGNEPDLWTVVYSAEGEEETRKTFTGHSVTVSGLSLGKVYTFRLDAGDHLSLDGATTLELMASRLILAENISVTSGNGNDIFLHWNAPGDIVVDSWDVRCYNNRGYDQTVTVADTQVQFTDIDPATEYTVEITASGMTQPVRTGITANPINIQSLNVEESGANQLKVTWDHSGTTPEGGWLLIYTIDGSERHVVKSQKASAVITPRIPGAKYLITIQSADSTSVFNSVHNYTAADAEAYNANALRAEMLTIDLLKTPEEENWYYENIADSQLTNQFQSGDNVSIALRSTDNFYLPGSKTSVLFVIHDSYGNVLFPHTQEQTIIWKDIWTGGDSKNGELDLPSTPTVPGEYVLNLYFDGMSVAELPFTIS